MDHKERIKFEASVLRSMGSAGIKCAEALEQADKAGKATGNLIVVDPDTSYAMTRKEGTTVDINYAINFENKVLRLMGATGRGNLACSIVLKQSAGDIGKAMRALAEGNPDAPCTMTRKKVYNERVYGKPAFWELTTYTLSGKKLRSGQYSVVFQEGYLAGLVEEQFSFPLEAAEDIE